MSKRNRARVVKKQEAAVSNSSINPRNWVLGLILVVTFLAFANTIFNGFAYDDNEQILKNDLIRSFSNIPTAFTREVWFFRVLQDKDPNENAGPTTPYYRPMFTVYLMMGWKLFGATAAGWHLASVLMHLVAVLFVFLIMEKVTGDLRLTGIATILFAIHPLRTESVAWISGVTDLFLALFLLPSFYYYMLYREAGKNKHLVISLGLFMLAAFSKEPAIALPIFIVAYEIFIINQEKKVIQRIEPAYFYGGIFFLVSAFYFAMRYYALGFVFSDKNYTSYAFHEVLLTIPLVVCKYLGLLVWPVNLSIFHATPLVKSPLDLRFILPLTAILGLAAAMWPLRKNMVARFAILWFSIHLLPVLNLSAFAMEFMVQERYAYIPSIGFSLLLAMGLAKIPVEEWISMGSRRTARIALVALIALLLGGKTLAQNTVWKDDLTLWTHGTEVASDQTMPYYILGFEYIDLQRPDKVVETLEQYMKLDQKNLTVMSNLAMAHLMLYEGTLDRSHIDRTIALCEKGLALNDQMPLLWDSLGRAYTFDTEMKNYTRAHAFFDRAIRLAPDNAVFTFHKGATYAKEGNNENAIRYLELARSQEASLPDPYKFLGYIYSSRGQIQEAIDSFGRYLQLQPNAADAPRIGQSIQQLRAKLQSSTPQS